MLPLLLLLLTSTVYSENCSHIYDGQHYTRTTVLTTEGLPTNLIYNPNTKDLLFTLIDLKSLQNDDVQTKMEQYIVKEGAPIKIDNINGQAAAVDEKTGKVYIASDNGLHVLDEDNHANFLSFQNNDIIQLYKPSHSDELYATMYPENEVYVLDLDKNEKTKVKNVPCAYILAVDDNDNIYYECDSKYVKMLLNGFQEPIEFVGIPKNSARALHIDWNSRVILAANDGLYQLRSDNMIPVKLMNLDFVPSGLAFDKENIYVSTNGIIFKYIKEGCPLSNKSG